VSREKARRGLGLSRNVIALGGVSFFTDMATEMVAPLLPKFVTSVLGANRAQLGAIEGGADALAALLKLASGWWSDRLRKRKPLVVLGYTMASVVRPFVAAATHWGHVLAVRMTDRVGKGMRDAPRDALITESVEPRRRGRAFGFHRAADNAGAAIGALIAAFLVHLWGDAEVRTIFWLAAVPGALAIATLLVFVRDIPGPPKPDAPKLAGRMDPRMKRFLAVLLVFTLGNSSDAFLLLRASDLGVPLWAAPLIWAVLQTSKAVSATPGGALSDRLGRRPLIVAGWVCYAAIYVGFAFATEPWHAWALFAGYGIYYGLTEAAERALVADLASHTGRGTAFGWYNLVLGIGLFPASILFGTVWDTWGPAAAFLVGATLAAVSSALLLALVRPGAKRLSA
jgi:MFS family permease